MLQHNSTRPPAEVRSRLKLVFDLILSYDPETEPADELLQRIDAEAVGIADQVTIDAEALAGVEVVNA